MYHIVRLIITIQFTDDKLGFVEHKSKCNFDNWHQLIRHISILLMALPTTHFAYPMYNYYYWRNSRSKFSKQISLACYMYRQCGIYDALCTVYGTATNSAANLLCICVRGVWLCVEETIDAAWIVLIGWYYF